MIYIDEKVIKKYLENLIERTHNEKHIKILKKFIANIDTSKNKKSGMYM